MFLNKIDSAEITKIVNSCKDETAAGHDKVTIKMLKYVIEFVVTPLVYIYNLSLEQNVFPDKLKLAVIKPLHKGGDPTNINNYRPISLLSNFSKIFEKIIKSRLMAYLEANKLLSKNQFGFRPGIGTEDALYNTTKFLYNELDKSNKVIAVFLDLTKAFDTVDHQILLDILQCFGIMNNSLNWFRSYLFNRTQIVKINDITGNEFSIEYGVPQGSVWDRFHLTYT